MTDNDDNDIELGILAEDVVRNASAEVDTMRRTSAFDADPLRWELDGEVGIWDMCMVVSNFETPAKDASDKTKSNYEKIRKLRGELFFRLSSVGVMYMLKRSADGKTLYVLLSAKRERLELQAELMGMEFETQPRYGGGYLAFKRDPEVRSKFLRAYEDDFFTVTQRQAILKEIINQNKYLGGASVSIRQVCGSGVVQKWFPFHTHEKVVFLREHWAIWKFWKWGRPQPLDQLRGYFGEELTLYFAWLGFYTWMLTIPTVAGIIVFIVVLVTVATASDSQIGEGGTDTGSNIAGWFSLIYAVLMMLWATMFLEFWKRYNNTLAFKWNMLNFEASERSRPEYKGQLEFGVHAYGEWVGFDPEMDKEELKAAHVVPTVHYPSRLTKSKVLASFVPLLVVLAVVIIAMMAVLALRLWLQTIGEDLSVLYGLIGSIIGAVLIIVFNVLYGKLAVILNNWENHRTETEFNDALIFKTFLFQFVNTFTAMYYIAFIKRANDFGSWVKAGTLKDRCKQNFMDERGQFLQYINDDWFPDNGFTNYTFVDGPDGGPGELFATGAAGTQYQYNVSGNFPVFSANNGTSVDARDAVLTRQLGSGCMSELMQQLATLMIVNLVIGQTKEILIPLAKVQVKKLLFMFRTRGADDPDEAELARQEKTEPWAVQAKLNDFAGTFDEYAEMAIQYCMVVTFAAAFPLAPLLAVLNNVVEIRTDAIKILNTNNKPYYKGAEDIGGWYGILELVGYIAVVTNTLLIVTGFSVLPVIVNGGLAEMHPTKEPYPSTGVLCVIIGVVLEHLLLVLKYALAELVPDMPSAVRRQLARREFLRQELEKELEHRPHFFLPSDEEIKKAAKSFDYGDHTGAKFSKGNQGTISRSGIVRGAAVDDLLIRAEDVNYSLDEKKKKKKSKKNKGDSSTDESSESTESSDDSEAEKKSKKRSNSKQKESGAAPPPPPPDDSE